MTHLEAHNTIEALKARVAELEAQLTAIKTPRFTVYPPVQQELMVQVPPILYDMQIAYDYPTPMPEELLDGGIREKPGIKLQRKLLKDNPAAFVETLLALEKESLKAQSQAAEGIERARLQANVKPATDDEGPDLGTAKALEVIEELQASFEAGK